MLGTPKGKLDLDDKVQLSFRGVPLGKVGRMLHATAFRVRARTTIAAGMAHAGYSIDVQTSGGGNDVVVSAAYWSLMEPAPKPRTPDGFMGGSTSCAYNSNGA
jgi:hypothetical protein